MSTVFYWKLIRVIKSCKTLDHWLVAEGLVKRVCRQSGAYPDQLETLKSYLKLRRRLVSYGVPRVSERNVGRM